MASTSTSSSFRSTIEALAHPRFPGTYGAIQFRERLSRFLREVAYTPRLMSFERRIGDRIVHFTNVVATPDEESSLNTLLVAHADSLPEYPGAIDAASCMAAMIEIARRAPRGRRPMLAFVDGEEAYPPHAWTTATALSGSQYLAQKLIEEGVRPDLVVVLDLWGAPLGHSTFAVPRGAVSADYRALARIDRGLFPAGPPLFVETVRPSRTQDDAWSFQQHPAWYRRVVDLISTPFPPQWHDHAADVPSRVDYAALERATRVLEVFLAGSSTRRRWRASTTRPVA